ncbi:AT hook motif domain containing protein [Acanthamoeba castellanii str. Neff]|uniref:AT hook motif domain containing protein n=1 Tax=Acanthamoeba castellanii (strain ATCC 30010 / Neff) TaxID=1257118 RepID=L8H2U7_ACACF|nr:AT hook motif domain containing protein [Acanthamoeba castellanii str. Neff]ELR18716.1 AT hook motif domain containing protein [Acanthamoeba castellanii str. Neff]
MERGPPTTFMRNDHFRGYPVQISSPNFPLNALLRPKACLACRLAHASCDRTGRADTCQPPPQRKRGRPRKDPSAEAATTATDNANVVNGSGSGIGSINVSPPAFGSPQFGGSRPVSHHTNPAQPPRPFQAEQGAGWADAGGTLAHAPAKRRRVELERDLRDGVERHHHHHPDHHHHDHHQVDSNADVDEAAAEADFNSDEADSDDYDQVYFESVNAHLHPPPTTTSHSSHSSSTTSTAQPRRGRGTSEEQASGAGEAQGGLSMVKSLLLLLVDEVREMKREFGQVRGEVAALRAWQGGVDDRLNALAAVNEATRAKMEDERAKGRHMHHVLKRLLDTSTTTSSSSLPSTLSPVSSMSMLTVLGDQQSAAAAAAGVRSPPFMYSSPEAPSAYLAQRITPMLPFLKDYDFGTVPFVLDDISKPFFAARMKEMQTFEELESPVILFSSPSMCALLNYRVDELQGQTLRMIARPAIACYAAFTIRMLARSEPVGEVFTLNAVWAAKNRSLRLLTRHQFLYGPRRMTNWLFVVVDAVLEENVPVPPSPRGMILQNVQVRIEAWRKAVETAHPREKAALLAVLEAVDVSAPPSRKMLTYFANYAPPPPGHTSPPSSSSSSSSSSSASSLSSSPVDGHSPAAPVDDRHGHGHGQHQATAAGPTASEQRREAELAEMVHALYDDQQQSQPSQPHPHENGQQQQPDMPATPGDPWLEFRGLASPTWL